jgi:hypothetical protein
MTHSFEGERQLRLGRDLGRSEVLHRLFGFDCRVKCVEAIIPDLNGDIN